MKFKVNLADHADTIKDLMVYASISYILIGIRKDISTLAKAHLDMLKYQCELSERQYTLCQNQKALVENQSLLAKTQSISMLVSQLNSTSEE